MTDAGGRLSEEQVARGMASLPERFADRLEASSLRAAQQDRDAGEWLMAAESVVFGLARAGGYVTTRERADLRRYLRTFTSPHHPECIAKSIDRLSTTLEGLSEVRGAADSEIPALGRQAAARFAPRIPEDDRWEIEDAAELEDWEDLAASVVRLAERHRIPLDAAERVLLWKLLEAFDRPRTRLWRLPRIGLPSRVGADPDRAGRLTEALERRDARRWAELVSDGPLYVPTADPADPWPQSLPAPDDPRHVVVFTTPAGYGEIVGDLATGYMVTTVEQLRRKAPAETFLVVDPSLPTGVALTFAEFDAVQGGRDSLAVVQEVTDQVTDAAVRDALDGDRRLAGREPPGGEPSRTRAFEKLIREQADSPSALPSTPPPAVPSYFTTPDELAEAARMGDLLADPGRTPPPQPDREKNAHPVVSWLLDGLAPRLIFLVLGFLLAIILPGPVGFYGPALGAATAALLWGSAGRRSVAVAMTFLAVFFAVVGTVVLLVVQ